MSTWEIKELGEVLKLVIDHRGKTPKKLGFKDFHDNGYPVLSAKHVKTDILVNKENIRFANNEMYKKWMKVEVEKGDLVLTSEAPLGEVFYLDGKTKYVLGQRVFGLRVNQNIINPLYLLSWLASNKGQVALKERASGSTVIGIKQSELLKIKVDIPTIEQQNKIASIRKSLTDKIQLNTETNQTLENIAQAIFKSWFIDFDPVHAKANALANGDDIQTANRKAMMTLSGKTDTELTEMAQQSPTEYAQLHQTAQAFPSEFGENGLPLGWEMKLLSDFGEIICGKTPPKTRQDFYGNDIPFIKIPDMHNKTFIIETTDNLTQLGADSQHKKYIEKGDVCVSCIATVGL